MGHKLVTAGLWVCARSCVCADRLFHGPPGALSSTQEPGVLSRQPAPPPRLSPRSARCLRCRRPRSDCSFTCLSSLQTVSALGARDRVLFFSVFPQPAQDLAQSRFSIPAGPVGGVNGWMDGRREEEWSDHFRRCTPRRGTQETGRGPWRPWHHR